MKDYKINEKEGTITYIHDSDTGKQETARIVDLMELLFWFRSREDDLRRIAYAYSPIARRLSMQLVNGFYVGRTEDLRAVKVTRAKYEQELAAQELYTRQLWLMHKQEDKGDGFLSRMEIDIQRVDDQGRPVASYKKPAPTLEDTPMHLIQARLNEIQTPEWWVDKVDNLDLGIYVKLP